MKTLIRELVTGKRHHSLLTLQLFVLCLCALLQIGTPPLALADDSVKRLIFEDCDAASGAFSKLPIDQQISLIDFLTRIIELNTQSPTAPEVFAVAPGAQLTSDPKGMAPSLKTDLVPGSLWQSTDAKRELHAKRCALRILKGAGALALEAIPTLVATYTEQSLSDEIAVSLEEVIGEIAELCHLNNVPLSSDTLNGLINNALGAHPLLARNVLFEYRDSALAPLITTLATRPEAQTSEFISYLRGAYRSNSGALFREVLGQKENFTPEQLSNLLKSVELPPNESILGFIPELINLSLDQKLTAIFTPLLGEACIRLGSLSLDSVKQSSIADIPAIIDTESTLSRAQVKCLVGSSSTLTKKAAELLKSSDISKVQLALDLAIAGLNVASSETRAAIYSFLTERLADSGSPIWDESLKLILLFPERKTETFNSVQQILKTALKSKNAVNQSTLLNGLFKLLYDLNLKRDPNRLSSQLTDALLLEEPPAYAISLAKGLGALDQRIISRAFLTPPSAKSLAALRLIIESSNISSKSTNNLIELLKYRDSQLLAERGLIKLGKSASVPLRKAIPRLTQYSGAKLYAISVLRTLKLATPHELSDFDSHLGELNDCSFIKEHEELLCKDSGLSATDALTSLMRRCMGEFSLGMLESLSNCNPSMALALLRLGDGDRPAVDNSRLLTIAKSVLKISPQEQAQVGANLAMLLTGGDSSTRLELLRALMPLKEGDTPAELLSALNKLAAEALEAGELANMAITALGQAKYTEFPWRDFVKRAIESAEEGVLANGIALNIANAPENEVIAETLAALESKKSERVVGAALVGAALGAKAIPLVSKLWQLRSEVTPAIRYTTSLALLQINPLTPDLEETVALVLLNRFFQGASMMPISWRNTVAINDLDRSRFGTVRAERLKSLLDAKHSL
jgi:hypothetical protein